ncbi:hypothetical protein ACFE04_024720 [Oxalis oulophora]
MMRRQENQQQQHEDQTSRILYEVSALVLSLLRSGPDESSSVIRRYPSITPAGLASLLLGVSLALMLCGSVTFFIGFLLMPWVLGLVMLFYVVAVFSLISMLGRSVFSYALQLPPSQLLHQQQSPPSPTKDNNNNNNNNIPAFVTLLFTLGDKRMRSNKDNYQLYVLPLGNSCEGWERVDWDTCILRAVGRTSSPIVVKSGAASC